MKARPPLKAKASNRQQATPAVHDEDDPGQNTSPTMLLILSALPAPRAGSAKASVYVERDRPPPPSLLSVTQMSQVVPLQSLQIKQ